MFQQLTNKTKKKKKHRPFYEAVDAHARRRLKIFATLQVCEFCWLSFHNRQIKVSQKLSDVILKMK